MDRRLTILLLVLCVFHSQNINIFKFANGARISHPNTAWSHRVVTRRRRQSHRLCSPAAKERGRRRYQGWRALSSMLLACGFAFLFDSCSIVHLWRVYHCWLLYGRSRHLIVNERCDFHCWLQNKVETSQSFSKRDSSQSFIMNAFLLSREWLRF
jgi:hypothetical protein